MFKNSCTAKILYLLGEIQNHLHDGTIKHELNQIVRHTRDTEIIDICERSSECLGIKLDMNFYKLSREQHIRSLKHLEKHLKWAKEKFDEVIKLIPECDSKWTESPFRETEIQLLFLSKYFILLDKVPDTADINAEVVKIGDLVAISCKDDEDQNYDHYGIIVASSQGFRVAHFFTGATVKPQNSIVEKGFGYVHELNYHPEWVVKQHLPQTVPYSLVEERIKESKTLNLVWNKLRYNCEHWAREMFNGEPECTQLEMLKEEIRNRRKSNNL
ncbi:hypothetical protein [Calothrix sp. UHCC 0171]|uniref:hypothetical protein n=1 Tax=Calothrix sp. UHCC 0171 TaxID=3110245 RepID=UPI002B20616D|nr:hypothetical protein [Calothrix sp. UHCC 0171]MEA5573401.1 hypothetical protein [Calothrix sp. UHCC 0171]